MTPLPPSVTLDPYRTQPFFFFSGGGGGGSMVFRRLHSDPERYPLSFVKLFNTTGLGIKIFVLFTSLKLFSINLKEFSTLVIILTV